MKTFGASISQDKISLPLLIHTYASTDCFALIWPMLEFFSYESFERSKLFIFFAENSSSSSLKNWNISCANDLSAQNVLQCVMVHVVDGSGPSNVTCHGNCTAMFSLWNVLQCVKKCRFQLNLGRITMRRYRPKICILNTFAMDWWKLLVLSR